MREDKKLNEFLKESTSTEAKEDILKSWISNIVDAELRDEMAHSLESDFTVKKSFNRKSGPRYLRPFLAVAASITLLVSVFIFHQNNVAPQTLAEQYLENQYLQHPGSSKGIAQPNGFKTEAILAFNNGDFAKAALEFEKIEVPTQEDTYYLGLAYLKNGQYARAAEKLAKCIEEGSRFKEEAIWFLAVSLIFDGKDNDSQQLLEQIEKGDWHYDEAQKLIKSLRK